MISYIPWMLFNPLNRYPIRHCHEYLLDEILALGTHMAGNLVFAVGYLMDEELYLLLAERQMSAHHRKQDNSTAPYIREEWVIVLLALYNFWRGIAG